MGYWNGLYTQPQVEITVSLNKKFFNLRSYTNHRSSERKVCPRRTLHILGSLLLQHMEIYLTQYPYFVQIHKLTCRLSTMNGERVLISKDFLPVNTCRPLSLDKNANDDRG